MEPFIQLSCGEQCPRKSSKLTETSFIDKRKVSELFWIDLLETKCQEGLGEVSEALVNDENLTPEDFHDDQQVSPKISALQENNCHTSTEPTDCNEFKTPLNLRYGYKSADTPCLFSQDESASATPISSQKCNVDAHARTQSQPTCIGDNQSVHGSPASSQVLCTPDALSRNNLSVGADWSKRKAKTPDLLAEIMGRRRSSLSCLLAGSDDDEIAEWSESMATPPLKITRPAAADETDGEEEAVEKPVEEECQPSSRRIARVLFSVSTTGQCVEPLELSLDDTVTNKQPLDPFDGKDADGDTVETTDGSHIQEEFLLEYSYHSDSTYQGKDRAGNFLEGTLVSSPSLNNCGLSKTEYDERVTSAPLVSTCRPKDLEPSIYPNSLHSPFPDNFLSPSNRVPLKALAQSTPKPNISRSTGFDAVQNDRGLTKEGDTSLPPRDTHALIGSPSPLCDKALTQGLFHVGCHTSGVNNKFDASDVTFGSPSRSFELAMAREAEKLSSGLGPLVSPSSPSPPTYDVLNETTRCQSTEVPHHTNEIAIKQTNVTKSTAGTEVNQVSETTTGTPFNQATKATTGRAINQANRTETSERGPQNQACEISPGSENSRGSLTRRKSFCKVPGLRRSTRTKRFLYPTASQVSKEDTAKRCRENSTAINDSGASENEKTTETDEKGVVICDKSLVEEAVCNLNCDEIGEGEEPVAKKLKVIEKEKGCDSWKDLAQMSSEINGAEKNDDVLFDMDTLSQLPVECVMSPPSINSDSESLNVDSSSSMARRDLNVTYTIATNKTQRSIEKIVDPVTNCRVDGEGICNNDVLSEEKSIVNVVEESGRPVFEAAVSSSVFETNASFLCSESSNAGFPSVTGKRTELSRKTLNCTGDPLEDLNLPRQNLSTRSMSQECDLSTVSVNGVARELEMTNANGEMVDLQALYNRVSSTLSTTAETEDNHSFRLYVTKPEETFERTCSDMTGESSAVQTGKIDGIASEFVEFHTASGKRVSVSSEALAKAKATMEEVDNSLGLHERPCGDHAASAKIPSTLKQVGTSCKLMPNVGTVHSSSTGEEPDLKLRADHVISKRENMPEFEQQQMPAFCGFSTACGKQVRVSEASMKQARRTLSEIDAELNADFGELPSKVTRENSPTFRIRKNPSVFEKEVGTFLDFQEVPRVSTGNDLVRSLPGSLCEMKNLGNEAGGLDLCEMDNKQFEFQSRPDYSNTNFCKANALSCVQTNCVGASVIEDSTLQNTGDIETKLGENVNDSLLEDLLNDCKKKRKYSMETISENPRAEEYSELKNLSSVSDNREAMEERENISTESRIDVVSTNQRTVTSVSVSEPPLSKRESTWNNIDEDLTLTGAVIADRESVNGFDTALTRAVKYLIVDKRNANQTQGEPVIAGGMNKLIGNSVRSLEFRTAGGKAVEISEDALRAAKSTMEKMDEEICREIRNKSGPVGPDSAFEKKDYTKPEGSRTVRNTIKGVDKDFSREDYCKRVADVSIFSGFHTAGGRKVSLSEEALKAGRDIMKRLVEDTSEDYLSGKQEFSSLLYTVSGCPFSDPENISTPKRGLGSEVPRLVNSKRKEAKDRRSGLHTTRGRREGANSPIDKFYSEADKGSKSSDFCGFQTASGQQVILSKEALVKGALIMQQIDKSLEKSESETLSSNASLSGFSGFQTAAGKRVNLSKDSLEKGAAIMQQIERSLEGNSEETKSSTACLSGFSGFQPTSEQRVEALEERAAIMQKEDKILEGSKKTSETSTTNLSAFPGFQTAAGKSVKISKQSLEKGAAIMKQIDTSLEVTTCLPSSGIGTDFSGFQTARGESVKLSKESLERGAAIMQRIDRSHEEGKANSLPSSEIGIGFSGFQTARGRSVQQIDKSLEEGKESVISNSLSTTGFSGFQTANGQSIKLSKESLEKGAAILQQIDKSLEENKENGRLNSWSETGSSGFQTARGQSVKLPKESLQKGEAIMQQIDKSLEESKENSRSNSWSETGFSGFQTARGQIVKLSKESTQKGAAIMEQIDKSLEGSKENSRSNSWSETGFSGFQTARGQSVKLSKESIQKGAAIMEQIDKSLEGSKENGRSNSWSETGFSGFQTARGQIVKLSKESIQKGAAILQQIDKSLEESKENGRSNSWSETGFSGFQTARGQIVKLSKESIQKGAAIMEQIDKSLEGSKENSRSNSWSETGFSGFQTARGQSVKLSKESIQKGAAIMEQIDKSLEESKENSRSNSWSETGFSGFQTARGQSVKLSKESLQKGAAIMQQIDKSLKEVKGNSVCSSASASGFSGFQTGSDQSVKLEKGMKRMQQMDKSVEVKTDKGESCITSSSTFSGFKTAGGKTVQVSQPALAKAKETMACIEKELSLLSPGGEDLGFRNIAEGKTSKVTNETGGHAKFINEGTDDSNTLVKNDKDDAKFRGFFTGGGQRVLVSEEALSKARTFLLETDNDLSDSKIEEDTEASLREYTVPAASMEAQGITVTTPERSLFVEHDEEVSREILESSEALLADESFMDAAEYLHDKQGRFAVGRSSLDTLRCRGQVLERGNGKSQSGVASGSSLVSSRRHSTPIHCSEDMFRANHTVTRNGMKPCTTTPSGILHDRRAKSFHVPLRARQSSYENMQRTSSPRLHNDTDVKNSSRSSDSNRSLKPLKALTPGCFKSNRDSFPRTSTPVNSTINRRTSVPRPQFITPYRKQQATRDVSPLARCSSTSGLPVSDSLEGQASGVKEPSPKKPRLSAPNGTLNTKSTHCGDTSKAECKTKPQLGFLSQVRRCSQRIKLKEFVGNITPGRLSAAELTDLGISPELLSVTSSNASSFRFDGRKYFSEAVLSSKEGVRNEDGGVLHAGTDGSVGLGEIQSAFLSTPGVDRQLISEEWIANHYRWIIWKLAVMEVAFPRHFAGRCLMPDWVLCQLKYRYDREIDNSNRSALKKIMERDDVSSRTMILCISSLSVSDSQTESVAQETNDHDGETDGRGNAKKAESSVVIELTDGWYAIRGLLDGPLTRLLNDKKLNVGQKLCIYGAELVGSEQAVSPLEAPSSLMLRLHANSTRRARWDAKLGFHSHTHAFPLPLASLFGDGGFTGCVDVIVLRQYPVQWMEKMADRANVFRNSRLEEREAKKFEADRHQRREKLFLKIQEQFEKEFRQPEPERRRSARFRHRSLSSCDLSNLHDGKEIYEAVTQASDPDALKEFLTERQIRALEDYRRLLQERKCAELQNKFERVWKEQQEESQLQRNVVPLLKVRVTDYSCKCQTKQNAVLSIWRPTEEVMQLLSEGSRLRIYHLTAAGVRFRQGSSELQLSATRTTRYEVLPSDSDVTSISYVPRQACSFDELRRGSSQQWSEVDIVGLVVFCSPLSSFSSSSSSVQTVYLSDEESNLVAIKFWGGLKAFGVEDLVKPRSFICCSNLTIRPDDRLQCPSLVFSELSSLTLKPRELHQRTALNKLQQSIPDLNIFMAHIQETLTSFLRPHRSSPSVDIKVNTVRMYGKSSVTTPTGWIQKCESSDATNNSESTDQENCSSFSDEKDRLPGIAQSSVCTNGKSEAQESLVPSLEEHSALVAVASTSSRAVSRRTKRKLLDNIPEPPPLSPLPSSIPDTVRSEFKRPRRVGSSGNVRLEQ